MAQFSNGGKHHEVHLSGKLARKIRDIQQQASIEERGEAVLAAFRAIVDRLENNPTDFGEPLYRLPALTNANPPRRDPSALHRLRRVRRPAASIPKKNHL